jgi:anti-sigma regulatory factor (Ser/Thr protein kinase)
MAGELARRAGFDETDAGRVSLVATELATNLVKHAGGGSLLAEPFDDADGSGIELLALDKGPGMADVQRCFQDGYSTAGSPGTGLGAISRVADRHAVFSRPGQGTVIMARCRQSSRRKLPAGRPEIGAVSVPYPGEVECGDGWAHVSEKGRETLLVSDGSGHGAAAAKAAQIAVSYFRDNARHDLSTLATGLHRVLAATRGAALAVVRLDLVRHVAAIVGIGNISTQLVAGGKVHRMVSHNGTAGHVAPRVQEFSYPYVGRPLLIMHSDGIGTRWDLATYPGLATLHPSLIAGVLLRDHRRARDDATVVTLRGAA